MKITYLRWPLEMVQDRKSVSTKVIDSQRRISFFYFPRTLSNTSIIEASHASLCIRKCNREWECVGKEKVRIPMRESTRREREREREREYFRKGQVITHEYIYTPSAEATHPRQRLRRPWAHRPSLHPHLAK